MQLQMQKCAFEQQKFALTFALFEQQMQMQKFAFAFALLFALFEQQMQMQMQKFAFAIAFALVVFLIQNLQHSLSLRIMMMTNLRKVCFARLLHYPNG